MALESVELVLSEVSHQRENELASISLCLPERGGEWFLSGHVKKASFSLVGSRLGLSVFVMWY